MKSIKAYNETSSSSNHLAQGKSQPQTHRQKAFTHYHALCMLYVHGFHWWHLTILFMTLVVCQVFRCPSQKANHTSIPSPPKVYRISLPHTRSVLHQRHQRTTCTKSAPHRRTVPQVPINSTLHQRTVPIKRVPRERTYQYIQHVAQNAPTAILNLHKLSACWSRRSSGSLFNILHPLASRLSPLASRLFPTKNQQVPRPVDLTLASPSPHPVVPSL